MDVGRAFLCLLVCQEVRRIRRERRTARYVPRAYVHVRVSQRHFTVMEAMVGELSINVRFVRFAQGRRKAMRTKVRDTMLVRYSAFRLCFAWNLVPDLFAFLCRCFGAIAARFLRIPGYLFEASR